MVVILKTGTHIMKDRKFGISISMHENVYLEHPFILQRLLQPQICATMALGGHLGKW